MSAPAINVFEFITAEPLPGLTPQVLHAAKRCLLDLVGVAAAGRVTDASRIAHQVAVEQWPAGLKPATLWFDGRQAAPAGVAFALAATIDSMDAHDGYKPAKGHAGVAVLPSLLAVTEAEHARCTAADLLSALIVGYEIACRVATAQHATSPVYSASGSWNAVGAAAVAARILKLPVAQVREAIGIAEYFGPRSPMMRVIDHTTMVKDSSSWGAMTGVNAAYLAAAGFTGAPAETVEDPALADIWSDLGRRWLIAEQYFKLWPICRWAQPAVTAALSLRSTHALDPRRIRRVVIHTFHEARRLAGHTPTSTDEAQYAIAFPTACAFLRGRIGVDEVAGSGLADAEVLALSQRIEFAELPEYNAAFPARRLAHLVVELDDGSRLTSAVTEPPGDPEHPLSDEQIVEKFFRLAAPQLGAQRAEAIHAAVGTFDNPDVDVTALRQALREPCSTHIVETTPAPAEPTRRRSILSAT